MDRNMRIAKELVRLAKSMVAGRAFKASMRGEFVLMLKDEAAFEKWKKTVESAVASGDIPDDEKNFLLGFNVRSDGRRILNATGLLRVEHTENALSILDKAGLDESDYSMKGSMEQYNGDKKFSYGKFDGKPLKKIPLTKEELKKMLESAKEEERISESFAYNSGDGPDDYSYEFYKSEADAYGEIAFDIKYNPDSLYLDDDELKGTSCTRKVTWDGSKLTID